MSVTVAKVKMSGIKQLLHLSVCCLEKQQIKILTFLNKFRENTIETNFLHWNINIVGNVKFIGLCNEILRRLKMKNHVKNYFTVLRNHFLRSHNEENSVKIYSIALCSEVLSCLHVENHVKISFLVLCNPDLKSYKEKIHVKISFIVLPATVFSRLLKVENHVKIPFMLLSNQVLSCLQLQVNNHVKISFKVPSYYVLRRLKLEKSIQNLFPRALQWSVEPPWGGKSCQNTFHIVALRWKIMLK